MVRGDNPIRRVEEDTLGRCAVARSFARQVLTLDATEGVVVGVLGPWGSGKTSFVNLARDEFEKADVPILDFNPWMFSGAEQLVDSFFSELAAQLKVRPGLAWVGRDLEEYAEALSGMVWLPVVGPWVERVRGATRIVGTILQRRKEGIGERRRKLEKALATLRKPIAVVLDDIDRLSANEIRDVFKLVRLTASFPNMIYVLAFDRSRVETALGEQGVPGRDYLEKILQLAVDLPVIPSEVLNRQIFAAIDAALEDLETPGRLDFNVWGDIFMEVIRPLIRNMRDVRRYAAAIHGTVGALQGQIALADVLALEAIRVFLPDVFGRLQGAIDGLTMAPGLSARGSGDRPQLKEQIDDLIAAAKTQGDVVRAMIEQLFPAGRRHVGRRHFGGYSGDSRLARRERRVAHWDILRLYLERVAGEGLQAFAHAEQAWARLADHDALESYLRSVDADRLQEVVASLEDFEDQFMPEHVVPATVALLNLLPDIPERAGGMFEFDAQFTVSRVTYRLLRSLGNPTAVEAAVHQILPKLTFLFAKLEVIRQVGYREGAGHELVSRPAAAEFEQALREEVRSRPADDLAKERDLVRLFLVTKREADPSEPQLMIADEPQLTLAVLRAARSEVRSQTMGTRAVRRSPRLAWDSLLELYGDEATLKERIESLKAASPEDAEELLELADQYLAGWRPSDFGGRGSNDV